jgi:putative transposase
VSFPEGWRGNSWQGWFPSFVLEDYYLLAATRYVEMNPVRSGLADGPEAYRRRSVAAHLVGRDKLVVKVAPLLQIVGDWRTFLSKPTGEGAGQRVQRHERTGRPLGDERVLAKLKPLLNCVLKPGKPGRKPKRQPKSV